MLSVIRNLVLFVVTFVAVSAGLRPSYTTDKTLRAKVDYFRQHKDEFDFVFFGSSRIYRCFDSKHFDRQVSATGMPMKSYNFAFQYHRPHEMNQLIAAVLASKPKRLKTIAVELMNWNPTILAAMRTHDRTPAWHTLAESISACQTIWRAKEPFEKKIQWWTIHASNCVARWINHGGGTRWIEQHFDDPKEHTRLLAKMERGNGFVALDAETEEVYAMRFRRFREFFWDIFYKQVLMIPQKNREQGTLRHFNLSAQLAQQTMIQQSGVRALFVIPTVRQGTPVMNQLADHLDHFFSYNHPLRWPHLYRRDRYWDRRHMNQLGAKEFSEVFAAEFVRRQRDSR